MMKTIGIFLSILFLMNSARADIVLGTPDARSTLVEFYDYQCLHCKAMAPIIYQLLQHNPQLRVVYRPIAALNPLSALEAASVLAASEQGKFMLLHHALMTHSVKTEQDIFQIAGTLNIDATQLKISMQSTSIQMALKHNQQLFYSTHADGIPLILIGSAKGVIAVHQGEVAYEVLQHDLL